MRAKLRKVGLFWSVLLSGCAEPAPREPAFAVRDSAGIELAVSSRPRWGASDGWRIDPKATLIIGQEDGGRLAMLDRVAGATRLPDGRIAVANAGDNTVRLCDAAGDCEGVLGGTGDGPGELRNLSFVRYRDGSIWAGGTGRLHRYDVHGMLQEVVSAPAGTMVAVFADGVPLQKQGGRWPKVRRERWAEEAVYFRGLRAGAADTIGWFPEVEWARLNTDQSDPSVVIFSALGNRAVGDSAFYYGWNRSWNVAQYAPDGRLVRVIARRYDVQRVRRKERNWLIDRLSEEAGLDDERTRELRRNLERVPVAETQPVHGSMLVDHAGRLWIQRYDREVYLRMLLTSGRASASTAPLAWDVFAASGEWLGPVVMPPNLVPVEIGPDYVLAVHFDPVTDVQTVRLHGLMGR